MIAPADGSPRHRRSSLPDASYIARKRRGSLVDLFEGDPEDELEAPFGQRSNEERALLLPDYLRKVYDENPFNVSPTGALPAKTAEVDPAVYTRLSDTLMRALKDAADEKSAVEVWEFAWRLDPRTSHLAHFARAQAVVQHRLLKLARVGLLARVLVGLLISYGDIFSDVMLAIQYFGREMMTLGALTVLFPCLTLVLHALLALANRDSWLEVCLALIGGKPILDTWKMLSGAKQKANQALNPLMTYLFGKGIEVMFEAVPQAVTQCIAFLSADGSGSALQLFAIASSFLSAGFTLANVEYDLDTSSRLRRLEPRLYGWMSDGKRPYVILVLEALFLSLTMCAKVFAWSALVTANPLALGAWIGVNFALTRGVKKWYGVGQTHYRKGAGVVDLLLNAFSFLCTQVFPMPVYRNPLFTANGPSYSFLSLAFFFENIAMIFAANKLRGSDDGDLAASGLNVWHVVLPAMAGASLCFVAMLMLEKKEFQWMWYRNYNLRTHFKAYVWCNNVYRHLGPTFDDHRASVIAEWKPSLWSEEDVKPWLAERWEAWTADPPAWFTEDWKKGIPEHLRPPSAAG